MKNNTKEKPNHLLLIKHKSFLLKALIQAKKAQKKGEVPVGAVIVYKNKIIASGHNLRETRQNALGHAELVSLVQASKKLKSWRLIDCDLYVTLEPCLMCAAALQQARIRQVYYGVTDSKGGAVSLGFHIHSNPRLNHRYAMTLIHIKECGTILSKFFKKKRNTKTKNASKVR